MFNLSFFDQVADEFIQAMVHDLRDPITQKQLLREINGLINRIENPIVRMFAADYAEKLTKQAIEKFAPLINDVVLSNPPESIDVSAKVVKETLDDKINSFAEKIKQELKRGTN